jgi:hypothetical protein
MANLLGSFVTVYANSPSQSTTVTLDDSGDTQTGRQVTFGDSPPLGWVVSGLCPAALAFALGTGSSVQVVGSSPAAGLAGSNAYAIQSVPAGISLGLKAGTGGDVFLVGSTANTLDPIQGPLGIYGQGSNTILKVDDQGTTSQQVYGVSATQITRAPATTPGSPTQVINYFTIASVNVFGGSGQDIYDAASTLASTALTSIYGGSNRSGNEFFVEDTANRLDDIQGRLALHGGGLDLAEAVDSGNTVGYLYTLTTGLLQRTNSANISYDGMGQFILAAADNPFFGHSPNTVNVESTAANVVTFVAVGNGDTVTLGVPMASGGHSLQSLQGAIRVQAAIGPNKTPTLLVDDSGNANAAARTVTLDAAGGNGYGIVGMSPAPIYALFDPTANVSIVGNAGNETFALKAFPGFQMAIDGRGGVNTLDYSGHTGDIAVDLRTGDASGLSGGIKNIENVTGSIGNDLIVGDANPNVLVGGTGRNILIGGGGGDTLTGSVNQDNILIGGTTLWDTSLPDLLLIMHEWLRTDLNFDQRMSDISGGGVGIANSVLTNTGVALNHSTVFADSSPDTLIEPTTNTTGRYWFFVDADDIVPFSKIGKTGDHFTKL